MTEYFSSGRYLTDVNVKNPLGKGGRIAHAYAGLVAAMWSGQHRDSVAPRPLKKIVSNFAPQFEGWAQHDSQVGVLLKCILRQHSSRRSVVFRACSFFALALHFCHSHGYRCSFHTRVLQEFLAYMYLKSHML